VYASGALEAMSARVTSRMRICELGSWEWDVGESGGEWRATMHVRLAPRESQPPELVVQNCSCVSELDGEKGSEEELLFHR
jgi:hypothetical protein